MAFLGERTICYIAIKVHDKRDVRMLSTFHEAKLIVKVKDCVNRNEPVLKPNTVVDYCKHIGGVDVNDQICQYYDVPRKSVKWWKTLFFHLFNLLLVNSYILYQKFGNPTKRRIHQTFRQELACALMDAATTAPCPQPNKGRKSEPIDRLFCRHFPWYIPCKQGAKHECSLRDCKAKNIVKEQYGWLQKKANFILLSRL